MPLRPVTRNTCQFSLSRASCALDAIGDGECIMYTRLDVVVLQLHCLVVAQVFCSALKFAAGGLLILSIIHIAGMIESCNFLIPARGSVTNRSSLFRPKVSRIVIFYIFLCPGGSFNQIGRNVHPAWCGDSHHFPTHMKVASGVRGSRDRCTWRHGPLVIEALLEGGVERSVQRCPG
jgi:hypothetical protein